MWVKTFSEEEGFIPKEQWTVLRKRGITILPEDWAILRYTVLKNCIAVQCKEAVGFFDDLFYTLDEALKQLPVP